MTETILKDALSLDVVVRADKVDDDYGECFMKISCAAVMSQSVL